MEDLLLLYFGGKVFFILLFINFRVSDLFRVTGSPLSSQVELVHCCLGNSVVVTKIY